MQYKLPLKKVADPVGRAADGLRRIVQALRTSSHAIEKKLGVSGAQVFVLQELSLSGGLSLRALAQRTRTDPSSVSVAVSRLEAHGLLRREQAQDDARRAELWLSRKGEKLLARAPEPSQARLIRALEQLSPANLTTLATLLENIAGQLGGARGAPPMFFEDAVLGARKKTGAKTKRGGDRARA